MIAIVCQVLLGVLSGVFFWNRTEQDWNTAGYALVLYFVLQLLASARTTHKKKHSTQTALPLTDNQCLYCCVPSKGKVALTRLGWLLVTQSALVCAWSYLFFHGEVHTSFFVMILANCVGIVSYYHMTLVDTRFTFHLFYLLVLILHAAWGLINSRSI